MGQIRFQFSKQSYSLTLMASSGWEISSSAGVSKKRFSAAMMQKCKSASSAKLSLQLVGQERFILKTRKCNGRFFWLGSQAGTGADQSMQEEEEAAL